MDDLDQRIRDAGTYAPDAVHAIVRVPGSDWRVVDSWYDPDDGSLLGLGIHYDADDPSHEWAVAADFAPLPDAVSLARDFNAPFVKEHRLARRRMRSWDERFSVMRERHRRAAAYLQLARAIREAHGRDLVVESGEYVVGWVCGFSGRGA